jgi:hypothetical protein
VFDRHPSLKEHTADIDTVPFKLLPSILEKADTWDREASHDGHLEVLFFLLTKGEESYLIAEYPTSTNSKAEVLRL